VRKIGNEKQTFWNQKAGGLSLGIVILALYAGFKFVNVRVTFEFFWYISWFGAIIINALLTDLFQNTETWIYNSMKEIENKDIDDKQKLKILKDQLTIAVNRYDTVFFAINGKDMNKIFTRIIKGSITVKELIVIALYALYDLVLRSGYLSLTEPFDISALFIALVLLNIIGAKSGFANLVVEMYNTAFNKTYTSTTMNTLKGYIRQLCQLFDIEYDETIITEINKDTS